MLYRYLVLVNLATALKIIKPDKGVGLLDTDVFGPSIPLMMNLHEEPFLTKDNFMEPLLNYGVKWYVFLRLTDVSVANFLF